MSAIQSFVMEPAIWKRLSPTTQRRRTRRIMERQRKKQKKKCIKSAACQNGHTILTWICIRSDGRARVAVLYYGQKNGLCVNGPGLWTRSAMSNEWHIKITYQKYRERINVCECVCEMHTHCQIAACAIPMPCHAACTISLLRINCDRFEQVYNDGFPLHM